MHKVQGPPLESLTTRVLPGAETVHTSESSHQSPNFRYTSENISQYNSPRLSESRAPSQVDFAALSANFSAENLLSTIASVAPVLGLSESSKRRLSQYNLPVPSLSAPLAVPQIPSHKRSQLNASAPRLRQKSMACLPLDQSSFAILEDVAAHDSPRVVSSQSPILRSEARNNLPNKLTGNVTLPPPAIRTEHRSPPHSPKLAAYTLRAPSPDRSHRLGRPTSPRRTSTSPMRTSRRGSISPVRQSPFSFKPQMVANQTLGPPSAKAAHRKGHKYKHSSVSMNLFLEPAPMLSTQGRLWQLADLYPIPSFSEVWQTVRPSQMWSAIWSLLHLMFAGVIFIVGYRFKLAPLSTLAHLVFYDAIGSLVMVFVNIMSNFDVWNKSSIAYPFGIGRLEVLVGFALGASLVMVGLDLISHFVEEFIVLMVVEETGDSHDLSEAISHHIHGEHGGHTNPTMYNLVLAFTIIATLVSSNYILAAEKINEIISTTPSAKYKKSVFSHRRAPSRGVIGEAPPAKLKSVVTVISEYWNKYARVWARNPTHFLTLIYSCYLVVFPALPSAIVSESEIDLDEMASLIVAILVCHTGWKLVKSLGGVLMCLYPRLDYEYHGLKSTICDGIIGCELFRPTYSVNKIFITKFNYELFVVGVKLSMKGASADEEAALRFKAGRIIKQEIHKRDNSQQSKIETTIDIVRV